MQHVLLDSIRVFALVLVGAGVFCALGTAATLVFAGMALFAIATVVELRRRRGDA